MAVGLIPVNLNGSGIVRKGSLKPQSSEMNRVIIIPILL
jgi:hypothetical protein